MDIVHALSQVCHCLHDEKLCENLHQVAKDNRRGMRGQLGESASRLLATTAGKDTHSFHKSHKSPQTSTGSHRLLAICSLLFENDVVWWFEWLMWTWA